MAPPSPPYAAEDGVLSSLIPADEPEAARVPPSSIWNSGGGHMAGGSPLEEDDTTSSLLRQPPPSSRGFGDEEDYGLSNEEKKDGNSTVGGGGINLDDRFAEHGAGPGGPANCDTMSNGIKKSSSAAVFSLTRSLPSTSRVMKRIAHILAVSSSAIFILIVFPLLCNSAIQDQRHGRTDFAAFYSAAAFMVVTLVLSFREILSHLYNWYAPQVQKFVVRILFMVPLYSVQSWMSLRFHGPARIYIDTIRDLYEAYVIQSFVYYLIELLGGEDRMADLLSRKDAHLGGHGKLASKVLGHWEMGKDFLLKIKHGVLQYVVVKTIMTLLTTFLLLPSGWYGEGSFSFSSAYVYTTALLNLSVMYALYCLVKLFHAIKSDLRSPVNWHPVGKFLCVKGVVFFTWWQSVLIYFLRSHGVIDDVGSWTGDDVAGGIIDYLVVLEMVGFSLAHMFTFTYKEYLPEGMEDKKEAGIVGWIFKGVDKRRRNRNDGADQPLQSALLDEEEVTPCIDENGNIDESSYRPPASSGSGFSRLEDPLSLREALWSSTVPRETLDDIKRLGVVSGSRVSGRSFGLGSGRSGIDISLSSMHNAERI
ncbi:hypothetical protein ACHAXT_004177 [Thalassiosira profunda]